MRGGKSKKQTIREPGGAFLAFDELIKLDEFLAILSKITGILNHIHDLNHCRGGAHESLNGERLLPRIDYNYQPGTGHYGRLNLLAYLNPEWKQKWVANWNITPIPLMQAQIEFGPVQ